MACLPFGRLVVPHPIAPTVTNTPQRTHTPDLAIASVALVNAKANYGERKPVYQTPQIDELAKALANAQKELKAVSKNRENPHFRSKYADLGAIVEYAGPILAKEGLCVVQAPETEYGVGDEKHDVLTTTVYHSSGQHFSFSTPLYMAKKDAQGHGSAITYARRYAYGAALGIVTDEDDDGNAASEKPAPKTTSRPAPAPVAPGSRPGYKSRAEWEAAQKKTDPTIVVVP